MFLCCSMAEIHRDANITSGYVFKSSLVPILVNSSVLIVFPRGDIRAQERPLRLAEKLDGLC